MADCMQSQTENTEKRSRGPSQRLSRRILTLGLLISLAILVSTALYLHGKRESLLAGGIDNARRYNILLLEQTARIYDSADILLRATVTALEDGRFLAANDERGLYDLLNSYITGMPHIRALSVLDAEGTPMATTFRYPSSRPNFAHRAYFQALRDSPDKQMYIDVPVRRRSDPNQWLLNVARRLPSADGEFGGVVVVSLVPEYFSTFYDSLDLQQGSYVSLLREDSTLLMRHPAKDEMIGKVFGRNPAIQPFLQQRLPQASLRMYSHISKSNVLLNCRFASSHPIYICISTREDTLLSGWKQDAVAIGIISVLISMTLFGLFIMLYGQIRRREAMASELSQKNQELEQLSSTDHLTGIPNRHSTEDRIQELVSKAVRHDRPFSLILIDIDNFKAINDTHGHAAGDRVLQEFGTILTERIRASDTAGRWGGEEFLIVCDESDIKGAGQLAETLRQYIERYRFNHGSPLTASFGVTQYQTGEDSREMFSRADKLLYAAKNTGRNRVVTGQRL